MTDEDEAFEDLAKRQGDWGLQGSRKHQIMRYVENNARNEVIEEVAEHIEKCSLAFGKDTIQSFTAYIRGLKIK
jgi:archaellum component FlaC